MKYLLLLILLSSDLAHAIDITTAENIHIQAEVATADLKNEIMIYSGNVTVNQTSMSFKASTIEEHRYNKELIKFIARGNPAVYVNELASEGNIYKGTASEILYVASENKVILTNYKIKDSTGNTNSGNTGVYLLEK